MVFHSGSKSSANRRRSNSSSELDVAVDDVELVVDDDADDGAGVEIGFTLPVGTTTPRFAVEFALADRSTAVGVVAVVVVVEAAAAATGVAGVAGVAV